MKRQAEYDLQQQTFSKKCIDQHHQIKDCPKGDLNDFIKDQKCIDILLKKGVKSLFPIQFMTFHHIRNGKDLIARDRTGSGKTLAFALPVILRLRQNREFEKNHLVKFLIVLPTRELTIQVKDEIQSLRYKDQPDFRVIAVYGKSDINYQIDRIKKGIDIIVATPGRLIDLLEKEVIKMNQMQVLCLDQADQMLKIGFKEEIEKIYRYIKDNAPKKTQNLLFSATIPQWLQDLSDTYLDQDRQFVNLIKKQDKTTPQTLDHYSMKLSDDDDRYKKTKIITNLIKHFAKNSGNSIIFCERKIDATTLSQRLNEDGIQSEALHGDVPQNKREEAYRRFKIGKLKVLVATNVAARGLDFPDIDLVIQTEPPNNTEPYIHRSGRTARKGKKGVCVTLFTYKKQRLLQNIQRQGKIEFRRLRSEQFMGGNQSKNEKNRRQQNNFENQQIEVFVKYLPSDKSEYEVREFFERKDIQFKFLKLLKTSEGQSKGCAFIKFKANADRNKCLDLDGESFQDNRLSITLPNKK